MTGLLCGVGMLTVPVSRDIFVVQTDASGVGVSGVLSVCRDGEELPVGFYSRQLKDAEKRYLPQSWSVWQWWRRFDTLRCTSMGGYSLFRLITRP